MKSFATLAAVAALASFTEAKKCQNITVPVTISARNGVFDQTALTPENDIEVTNIILGLAQQGNNYTADQLQGYATVSGSYNLAATYCAPDSGAPKTVQLLTHGIGFDRSYWDVPYNNFNYSYVNQAVDKYGYATLSHDRLGIGMSSQGEPVNEIQVLLEVAALKALTEKLRTANGIAQGVPKFDKVLHVGHSFGSVQSYALTAMYPTISDGLGLTGFSQNGSFLDQFLLGGNFVQANSNPALAKYVNGYLAPAVPTGVQINFFSPGAFDPMILPFAVAGGQPVTIGELLTIGGAAGSPNPANIPVHVITGERDVPFCGGDCLAAPTGFQSIPETSGANFENAAPFKVSIIPGAGHGLNLEYSAQLTYRTILDFFVQNGVGPNGKGGNGGSAPAPGGHKPGSGKPGSYSPYASYGKYQKAGTPGAQPKGY